MLQGDTGLKNGEGELPVKCRKCRSEIPDSVKFCPDCGVKQGLSRKPKSRGNGQGTAYQLPNKSWAAVRTLGYRMENGKLKRITCSKSGFRTKKEALDYLPYLGEKAQKSPKTFLQVYDVWEPTHRAGKSTMNCYRAAKKYFEPIWHEDFAEITVDDLQECVDDCPKGKRTKENMKALAGLLYKYAIPRHMATLNLGEYLIVGGDSRKEKSGLPLDDVERLAKAVGEVPWADYVLCQCYLGFRPSEFLALDAANYDQKERAFVGGAKTDAGRDRVVTVSPKIQMIIDRLTANKISGPVFCAKGKKAMSIETYRSVFYGVLEACGIDNPTEVRNGVTYHKYTPHSCRHTFATLMKRVEGADKDKLELIGHTSTEMLRHYQDVSFEDLRKVTDAL